MFLQVLRVVSVILRDLSSEYLAELMDLKVTLGVLPDALDDGGGPRNGKLSEPIALIEVSIHVLFHGLYGQLILITLQVIFKFGLIHIVDDVVHLLQDQGLIRRLRLHHSLWH
jgi:hypothetical protein